MENKPILDKKTGFYYYDKLPESARIAELKDFYIDNHLIIDQWFILKSSYSNKYYCYKTHPTMNQNLITDFLKENGIFVKK